MSIEGNTGTELRKMVAKPTAGKRRRERQRRDIIGECGV